MAAQATRVIFSIGHSNHTIEHFLDLLKRHGIQTVADVRTQPYSRYSPQFDSATLKNALTHAGLKYLFLGKELGGRPSGSEFYDAEGHVLYDRVAESPLFADGVTRILTHGLGSLTAMMCSEENPAHCHRHLLVERVLSSNGVSIVHVRGDGRLQSAGELAEEVRRARPDADQLTFFNEVPAWKSLRSVFPADRRPTSSEP